MDRDAQVAGDAEGLRTYVADCQWPTYLHSPKSHPHFLSSATIDGKVPIRVYVIDAGTGKAVHDQPDH